MERTLHSVSSDLYGIRVSRRYLASMNSRLVLVLVLVVAILGAATAYVAYHHGLSKVPTKAQEAFEDLQSRSQQLIREHTRLTQEHDALKVVQAEDRRLLRQLREEAALVMVERARLSAALAASRRAAYFSERVRARKVGARSFAKEVVSFEGKAKSLCKMNPWEPDKDCYRHYLEERFTAHVFGSKAAATLLQDAIEGGIKDIEGAENELAVSLRRQILEQSLTSEEARQQAAEFRGAMQNMVAQSSKDVDKAVVFQSAPEVALLIAPTIMKYVLPTVTAGVGGAWFSFGASIVAAFAVDAIMGMVYSPAAEVENKVLSELEILADKGGVGIEKELRRVISERSAMWVKIAKSTQ